MLQAQRHQRRLAVMFIDLDHFKLINDSLGHEAGDMMLQELSRRLKVRLRQGDTVARLGGDEFVMLLEESTSLPKTLLIAQKPLRELTEPCLLAGQEVTVTASIGVSTYPEDGLDAATLMRHADAAMYDAKANGRNLCQLYSDRYLKGPALSRESGELSWHVLSASRGHQGGQMDSLCAAAGPHRSTRVSSSSTG